MTLTVLQYYFMICQSAVQVGYLARYIAYLNTVVAKMYVKGIRSLVLVCLLFTVIWRQT